MTQPPIRYTECTEGDPIQTAGSVIFERRFQVEHTKHLRAVA
jgi:hypothetical protein